MKTTITKMDETKLAAEIVGVLDPAVVRVCSEVRDAIRYAVRGKSLKLRSILLRRDALRRLLTDPAGDVKIEYLKRDLVRAAMHRIEYRYPHAAAWRARDPEPAIEAAV
ncbi:MAG TPA: hypothetical protein VER58_01545 [Thermoanaerobaculia bacterium]|nr:hypothetical protein [Thermoanaerobaculia bacterium]